MEYVPSYQHNLINFVARQALRRAKAMGKAPLARDHTSDEESQLGMQWGMLTEAKQGSSLKGMVA